MKALQTVSAVDSHTAGEPTRVVVSGGPELAGVTVADKRDELRDRFDWLRSAVVNEPRGSDVLVGALLTEPSDPTCATGVIFFNNVGYLGMCGHGTIGVVTTLQHLGKIAPGVHRIETPVGVVAATLHPTGEVSVDNVPSYRHSKNVAVEVPGYRVVTGDVAWGGNWFFLVKDHGLDISLQNAEELTDMTWRTRQALEDQGITGRNGQEIDHVELFAAPNLAGAHSKNFVMCPGKAYDRSPCGTGTSAKLACLYADGDIREGEVWRQESIIGSSFDGIVRIVGDDIIPTITGRAFVTAETRLLFHPDDPFREGIR